MKSKWGVPRDTSSLERVLKMHYPGATTIAEAIEMAKANGPILPVKTEPEASSLEIKPTYRPYPSSGRLPYKDTED